MNKIIRPNYLIISIILTLGLSISLQNVLAEWLAPESNPPGGGIPEILNTSTTDQSKLGGLYVGGNMGVGKNIVTLGNIGIGGASAFDQKLEIRDIVLGTDALGKAIIAGDDMAIRFHAPQKSWWAMGLDSEDYIFKIMPGGYLDETGTSKSALSIDKYLNTKIGGALLSNAVYGKLWTGVTGGGTAESIWLGDENDNIAIQGNLGIGNSIPGAKLDVAGNIRQSGLATNGTQITQFGFTDASNYSRILRNGSNMTAPAENNRMLLQNVVAGSGMTGGYIDFRPAGNYTAIYPSGGASGNLLLFSGGAETMRMNSDREIGINTTNPEARVQINAGTGKEALRLISDTNYSPLNIMNNSNTDIFRVDQTGKAYGQTPLDTDSGKTLVTKEYVDNKVLAGGGGGEVFFQYVTTCPTGYSLISYLNRAIVQSECVELANYNGCQQYCGQCPEQWSSSVQKCDLRIFNSGGNCYLTDVRPRIVNPYSVFCRKN